MIKGRILFCFFFMAGPHAVVVLIILLIAVPMQLLLSTYLTQNGVHEESGQDIEQIRVDAVARYSEY